MQSRSMFSRLVRTFSRSAAADLGLGTIAYAPARLSLVMGLLLLTVDHRETIGLSTPSTWSSMSVWAFLIASTSTGGPRHVILRLYCSIWKCERRQHVVVDLVRVEASRTTGPDIGDLDRAAGGATLSRLQARHPESSSAPADAEIRNFTRPSATESDTDVQRTSLPIPSAAVSTSILGFGTGSIGNRRKARTEIESITVVEQGLEEYQNIRFYNISRRPTA